MKYKLSTYNKYCTVNSINDFKLLKYKEELNIPIIIKDSIFEFLPTEENSNSAMYKNIGCKDPYIFQYTNIFIAKNMHHIGVVYKHTLMIFDFHVINGEF
jgi:hypothetical protein